MAFWEDGISTEQYYLIRLSKNLIWIDPQILRVPTPGKAGFYPLQAYLQDFFHLCTMAKAYPFLCISWLCPLCNIVI